MSEYAIVAPEDFDQSVFRLIGKEWMLVTAKNQEGKVNTMTASWGGLGVMWGKNVAVTVLRPQRYTKEFIDQSESFTLSFYDDTFKKDLSYLGRSVKAQMKYANKLNAKNTIIIGDDELAKNEGNVKNMETREVTTISLDKIADCLK